MTRTAYLVFILLMPVILMAQLPKRDSLLRKLREAKDDTAKVKLLLLVASELESNEPLAASNYARSAESLSRKLVYKEGIYAALTRVAQSYYIRGLYDSSLIIFQKALDIANEMNDGPKTGIAYVNISVSYREKGEFEKALEYILKGRKLIDSTADDELKAKTDDAIQSMYFSRAEYEKAIVYGERALAFARQSGNQNLLGKFLINLSVNYLGNKRLLEAQSMLQESLAISRSINDKRIEAIALMNLADLAIRSREPTRIRGYSTQSLRLSREFGSLDNEALALRVIALSFLMEGKTDSSYFYAQQAYTIDTANQFRRETLEVLDLLSHIHFASGRIKEGFDYNRRFGEGFEMFVGDMIKQQSVELEKKYETEKKQVQIAQLQSQALVQEYAIEQKNTLNYILAGGAVALLTILLLSYRTFRHRQKIQRQKINALETEKQLTATEAVLKGEEQERARLAKDLHDGLGGMLSGIKFSFNTMKENLIMTPAHAQGFERSMDMLDSSIKEMRRVAHNLMPEALSKFGLDTALKDFCTDINKTGAIKLSCQTLGLDGVVMDDAVSIAIYRIVQELINNTMKHASAKNAIIQVAHNGGLISITVEDDGNGFDSKNLHAAKGMGWRNIQSRVDYLKGKVDCRSEPGKGTSVLIELNV